MPNNKSTVIRVGRTITAVLIDKDGKANKYTMQGTKEQFQEIKDIITRQEGVLSKTSYDKIRRMIQPETIKEETKIVKEDIKKRTKVLKEKNVAKKEVKKAKEKAELRAAGGVETTIPRIMQAGAEFFLKGFEEIPIPEYLVKALFRADAEIQQALISFWAWCLLNPNARARNDFYKYASNHNMPLTKNGFAVGWKRVRSISTKKEEVNTELINYVSEAFFKVKKAKKSVKKFFVWMFDSIFRHGEKVPEGITPIGNLAELAEKTAEQGKSVQLFTDSHSGKMDIRLGVPVSMPKKECDSNPQNDCSYGLHVGTPAYVSGFNGDTLILVLFNPMDVIAVPYANATKLRVSRYVPYAVLKSGISANNRVTKEEIEAQDIEVYDEEFSKAEFARLEDMLNDQKRKGFIASGEIADVTVEQVQTVKEVEFTMKTTKEEAVKKANKTVRSRKVKATPVQEESVLNFEGLEKENTPKEEIVEEPKKYYRVKIISMPAKLVMVKFLMNEFGEGLKETKEKLDQLPVTFSVDADKIERWKKAFKEMGVEATFKKR